MPNTNDFVDSYIDLPVKSIQQYYERLAWFLDRSSVFLKDKERNQTVILKNLSPGNLKVLVRADGSTKDYYIHINDVEPVLK